MTEHILFLTGKLAEPRLQRELQAMEPAGFTWEVRNIGLSVAALMTTGMIQRRVTSADGVSRIIVPGLCRGDLEPVSRGLGVTVERGPDDLKDLPSFFGRGRRQPDLGRHDVQVFAEIVEAPGLDVGGILERARRYGDDGADVIDVGCLPDTEFPHLEEAVAVLKAAGFRVSVDSADPDELLRGGRAGADYLLSLSEKTLWVAEETAAVPVLIPDGQAGMDSLYRSIEHMQKRGRPFIADSVLDPIHFGFTTSICRYAALRERYPCVDVMMGIGNLTELTEADTTGINALLFGMVSELRINHVLTTEVSPHARTAVREAELARRIMFAAREENSLPKGLHGGLLAVHERRPFPYSSEEIRELARDIRDPSYRVQVSAEAIHVFNRDELATGTDPFELFPRLARIQDDAPHAFYMGVELEKARLALELGKRYVQDELLRWGVCGRREAPRRGPGEKPAGTTLEASRAARRKRKAS